jgi:RND family efflux transporter MFP subunit
MKRAAWLPILLSPCLAVLGCGQNHPPPPPPKDPVAIVCQPLSREVTDYEDFTGRTEAVQYVEIRARVNGYLDKIWFEDGEEVPKGKVLFTIDPRTYEATLDQTKATLRLAQAHLNTMEANLKRAQELLPVKGISKEDYDKAVGDHAEAKETVGVAKANRNAAQVNFNYCKVKAPIAGRISRRMVDPGNTIKADDTLLTTIVGRKMKPDDPDQIYVTFYIDERTFLRIQRLIKEGTIPRDKNKRADVQVGLADDKGKYSLKGKIDFEDNLLDPGTGTHRVRAVLDNTDRFLSPGLFARVRLPIGRPHMATLVPEQALATDQGQKFLYVVKPTGGETDAETKRPGVVEYKKVKVGRVHRVKIGEIYKDNKDTEYRAGQYRNKDGKWVWGWVYQDKKKNWHRDEATQLPRGWVKVQDLDKDLREITEVGFNKSDWIIVRGLQRVRDNVNVRMDERQLWELEDLTALPPLAQQPAPKGGNKLAPSR